MQKRTVTITNRLGLHARAAAKLVKLAASHKSRVTLARAEALQHTADAKSIFSVLLLAATQNTLIEITVEGPDEELAMDALCRLIAEKFGEE
ncbi:MAG: HPr family phosphocarrier protein [Acidobacteria bacterium]|nr:HPr family phosphocarrier protein [Acidobacteriota bacterium]